MPITFPPMPDIADGLSPGEQPDPKHIELVREHLMECIRLGGGSQVPAKWPEEQLERMLEYLRKGAQEAAGRASEEAKALGKLLDALKRYTQTGAVGEDPFGCRIEAGGLQERVEKELKRRGELHGYSLAYEDTWRVQRGGTEPTRTFVGAHGANVSLDHRRMALLEALAARTGIGMELSGAKSARRCPDWFEDHEAAEERWRKVHAAG